MKTEVSGSGRITEKGSAMAEICSLRVGDALFGVPISHILEIIGSTHPQPVPLAPGFVGGLVHYRGDVLTTVSLRHLLHLPAVAGPQAVLILDSRDGCFGLLVDSVGEVLTIPEADLEPNPPNLDANRKAFFLGAYKLTNGLLVMLDADQLDPVRLIAT
jgi:purine-binding chemotaxis protein CheW